MSRSIRTYPTPKGTPMATATKHCPPPSEPYTSDAADEDD